jgi:hypothetical protein
MSNDYVLRVKTDKNIGMREFASALLGSWSTDIDPRLRPEYFDLGEPIRRSLEKEGVGAAVDLWVGSQMPVTQKGKDPRPFPWGCTVWMNRTAGDDLALTLFRFLIGHFEPAFGSISTEEDSRAKHWVTFEDRGGRSEQYMGLDVGRFVTITTDYGREVLPGVYWLTYFGPGAKSIVGGHRFDRLQAFSVEKLDSGHLVRAYASSRDVGTPSAARAEAEIMDQLGREHFFDKAHVDIEALKTDDVTAARVEKRIAEIKAARK